MRIGIDARMFHKAGIRRYATELVKSLSEIDNVNEYFVYLSPHEELTWLRGLNPNFNPVRLDAPLFSLKEQFLLITRLTRDGLDVLHTTFDFGAPLWPVRNVIVTVHDAFFGPGTFFRNNRTRLLYQLLTKYSVGKASRVIVISDFIREKLIRHIPAVAGRTDKIRVISNGVGREFSPDGNADEAELLKRKYNIYNKYLFCVGSFASGIKNLQRTLEAYCGLPEDLIGMYQLVIAGEILNRVPESLNMILRLRSENRILCLGYVPDEDLPVLYRNADIFIFPSLHEGFGIPVLEAMASGTPVITSNVTAMPEVAGDAALFVDPNDINEMRNAMNSLVENNRLGNELSGRGLERARQFSWLATAEKTLEVYKELEKK